MYTITGTQNYKAKSYILSHQLVIQLSTTRLEKGRYGKNDTHSSMDTDCCIYCHCSVPLHVHRITIFPMAPIRTKQIKCSHFCPVQCPAGITAGPEWCVHQNSRWNGKCGAFLSRNSFTLQQQLTTNLFHKSNKPNSAKNRGP